MRRSSKLKEYVRSISRIGAKLDEKRLGYAIIDCGSCENICMECANVVYGILTGGDIIANSHSAIKELKLMSVQYPTYVVEIVLEVIDEIYDLLKIYSFCNCMNKPQ